MMQNYRLHFEGETHPDIVVWVEEHLVDGIAWMQDYFASEIQRGVVFQADETIQIGWSIVLLKADLTGALEIWEAETDMMPIKWKRGVNNTIRQLMLQNELCAQLGVEEDYPSSFQPGIITEEFFDGCSEGFEIARESPDSGESGWLFRCQGDDLSDCRHSSLFEISVNCPSVVPFLALPFGASVSYTSKVIEVHFNDEMISSETNDFLKQLKLSQSNR
jgi:hypothetical protein